jgi:uncharacterized protein (TIGR00369 family)
LDNSTWGFESNCFVCEQGNERGLRIPFFHDEDGECVQASFCLDRSFSGAPEYVHGGVVLAILDEAMAWATIALAGRFAVTRATSTTFERPIRVDRSYTVEARVVDIATDITTEARVLDERGRSCASSEARFVALSASSAKRVLGTAATGPDRDLLAADD